MPTPETGIAGAPCWIDLMSTEVETSRPFYEELLGWSADEPDARFGGYFMFTTSGIPVAGGMTNPEPGRPDAWSVYLASDDAARTVEDAARHGAEVVAPPMAVDTLGTMAVLTDPTGARIGVWQPGDHSGFGVAGEAGAPGWFELHTRDYEPAVDFYQSVFGWTTQVISDTPEFRYTVLDHDGQQLGGIMDASSYLPADVASHWKVYFAVEDTDDALIRVEKLGGSVTERAVDTPYGRMAAATDATGAAFKLVGPTLGVAAAG